MKCHSSILISRMMRAALRVSPYCRFRIAAAGLDTRGNIIDIATNAPARVYRGSRGLHAEEQILFRNPRSLRRIVILRIGASGNLLPIHPCKVCDRLASKNGVTIERL